jgi:hypothetical protein
VSPASSSTKPGNTFPTRTSKKGKDGQSNIEQRLQELAKIFALAVGGFSAMDNHLHMLVRLAPVVARGWSDQKVVRRLGSPFPPRHKSEQPLPVSEIRVQWRLKDGLWVETARTRLQSPSWFMKCVKETLLRLANRQDETRGAFFEGRFKSRAWRFSTKRRCWPRVRTLI